MVFSYSIITPKNTTEALPLITNLPITKGIIHHWLVLFPSGNMGESRFRIRKGSAPILPINPEGFILGDGSLFSGDDFIYIKNEPFILESHSWNSDVLNDHTIYLQIFIKEIWTFSPYSEQLLRLIEESEYMKVL